MAWDLAIKGVVYLYQKKLGDGEYEYTAFKSSSKIAYLMPSDYYTRHSFDRIRQRTRKLLPPDRRVKAKERNDG